jgi:anti-sigma factor ChrR (cupin superfamily)
MSERFVNNINNLKFEPFDNYGEPVEGMSWHKISYDKKNGGFGTYILKMDPAAKSLPHIHQGFEEFYVIEGELEDADGKVFKKGDFITFEPGTTHNSHTKNGCLLIVFMRGINKPI